MVVVSNLPIEQLEQVRSQYLLLAKLAGRKMRIRFRGPRYDTMRLYCLKRNARAFSIYFD